MFSDSISMYFEVSTGLPYQIIVKGVIYLHVYTVLLVYQENERKGGKTGS